MRLPDFILGNIEPILGEWEVFARSIWPDAAVAGAGAGAGPKELSDDAEQILRATASDMKSAQTTGQQSDKSKGHGVAGEESDPIDRASETHGAGRVDSGFDLWAVVAEYRALRASVLRLWRESGPTPDLHDLDDITRFNESMDQSLTEAVRSYTEQVKRDREALLSKERASRIEAELANRAKDTFLAILSHELRTPLNAIVGWTSILKAEGCEEEELAEGLAAIERNTKAQVQLIEDILDVSRIVSGKLRMEIHPIELAEAVTAGVNVVRAAAAARQITIEVQLDPAASSSSGDAARIQQIVWNLVSNAVKFTPKGGRIRVSLDREQSSSQIEVSDSGQGISPELLPYIFDRFRQADSSARRKFGGLGLGLSIVKHLVEAHGGTVQVHSAGEGRGSTFTVRLPISAVRIDESPEVDEAREGPAQEQQADTSFDAQTGDDAARRAPHFPPVRLDGLRVLVVDDEADARRILVKVLEAAGAAVTAAGSAAEALEKLSQAPPDVLVSDLGMPGEDGFDLIRQVRARGHSARDLPAVALTAFVQKDVQRQAILAGFQVHVAKPVDPHDLTAVIASLTGRTG